MLVENHIYGNKLRFFFPYVDKTRHGFSWYKKLHMLLVLTLAMEMASHPNIFGTAATISDCNLTFHKDTFQNQKISKINNNA